MGWGSFTRSGGGRKLCALESLSSLGFEERNLGCPGNFAGMSRTAGGVQKVCAKRVRAHFSFPKQPACFAKPSAYKLFRSRWCQSSWVFCHGLVGLRTQWLKLLAKSCRGEAGTGHLGNRAADHGRKQQSGTEAPADCRGVWIARPDFVDVPEASRQWSARD